MAFFNYPATIDKNTPATANEVQTNFDSLLAWVLDNLVQKDGTVAMTGPLVLSPGEPAAPEQAANKAYVDAIIPIGTIWEYGGASLPTDWLWCNGDTYTNTSQPRLAAAIARNFTAAGVPAGSFQVPDKRTRVSVGADAREAAKFGLGVTGGQRNSELQAHFHTVPTHGHGFGGASTQVDLNHQHPVNIASDGGGAHDHGWSPEPFLYNSPTFSDFGLAGGGNIRTANWSGVGNHTHGVNGHTGYNHFDGGRYHTHGVGTYAVSNAPAFNTQETGAGTTLVDKNYPLYVAVNYIIYAGPA
jgi:microcystin-dependent protein